MERFDITAGRELAPARFVLDATMVREYLAVVDDGSPAYKEGLVPTTALAALGLRTILQGFGLPPGAVHVAQELTSHRAATVGQELSCRARVAQSSQRRDAWFLALEFTLADEQERTILEGRTTLLVPARGG